MKIINIMILFFIFTTFLLSQKDDTLKIELKVLKIQNSIYIDSTNKKPDIQWYMKDIINEMCPNRKIELYDYKDSLEKRHYYFNVIRTKETFSTNNK